MALGLTGVRQENGKPAQKALGVVQAAFFALLVDGEPGYPLRAAGSARESRVLLGDGRERQGSDVLGPRVAGEVHHRLVLVQGLDGVGKGDEPV